MTKYKKYTIKPLEWYEGGRFCFFTKHIKPFKITFNINKDKNLENIILIDINNKNHIIESNILDDAKKLAQKIWEKELLKILNPVNDVEIEIIKHMNEWINNSDEMQFAIERIFRDSFIIIKKDDVIKEIKSFTNNLIAEANTKMSVSDYRKYFFNTIKKKLLNNTNNNHKAIERNR
jgi:hypothetical protein